MTSKRLKVPWEVTGAKIVKDDISIGLRHNGGKLVYPTHNCKCIDLRSLAVFVPISQ